MSEQDNLPSQGLIMQENAQVLQSNPSSIHRNTMPSKPSIQTTKVLEN